MKRTELSEIGEFGLIDRIKSQTALQNGSSHLGIGDDAALIDAGDHYQVVSTDMLMEGIHFDLSYCPLKHLGYKAVAVNVSDIAAMNAIPEQIVVSLALSNRFSLEAIEELYAGIQLACEKYKVDLVGGDTTASRSGLGISVTAIGRVEKGKESLRSGAQNGDILVMTGAGGSAYLGLQVLEREKQVYLENPNMKPQLEKYEYEVGRQLKPEARLDIIHELKELGIKPTSMIDISDGLASEVLHISKNSGLSAVIFQKELPIEKSTWELALEFNLDPYTCLLNGGEDYELLFTISQSDHDKIKNMADISLIGYMSATEERSVMRTRSETVVELKAQGWTHFNKS
ncbi:MAG: thiamine-phosphate kinase [Cyclobacteriaceae bacterium]|nr:thiamine-phosphate kinase [Cyclobacteriaceae bacterium]MCH8516296.1 thiamine-phosphate kinase [Cyclobacteriaceae bacterium]